VLLQDDAAAAAQPTLPSPSAAVVPIAINASAYTAHAVYDLFAHPPSTLDLGSSGAPTFGPASTNEQYWSDGQHLGTWQLSQPGSVSLATGTYYSSMAVGLADNVRRQGLVDAAGHAYGLIIVPVYDTAWASSVHVVGFAELKLLASSISSTSAVGTFVPYTVAAFAAPRLPSPDLGATVIGLIG
jgi:hypothetical protein